MTWHNTWADWPVNPSSLQTMADGHPSVWLLCEELPTGALIAGVYSTEQRAHEARKRRQLAGDAQHVAIMPAVALDSDLWDARALAAGWSSDGRPPGH